MKSSEILRASNEDDLRALGAYRDVKNTIESEIDNKIGVNGWASLSRKITKLKASIALNRSLLLSVCEKNNFRESKKVISKILGIKVTARSWDSLRKKISLIVAFFSSEILDPYEYYERKKLKKFKNSSKLEGIDIEIPDEKTSLESVLEKHRR